MTQQEAWHIVEATTRFEVRGGRVWLREARWLRAVQQQRSEEARSGMALPQWVDPAHAVGAHRPPGCRAHHERRALPVA